MRGDVARPRRKAASAGEAAARKRENDLLEGGLNQIVVVGLAPAEDAIERAIDHADEPVVETRRDFRISACDPFDERFVIGRRARRRRLGIRRGDRTRSHRWRWSDRGSSFRRSPSNHRLLRPGSTPDRLLGSLLYSVRNRAR